jgi:xylan 1,4-beta-xylosidase
MEDFIFLKYIGNERTKPMTTKVYNPILPGFNPDPSILCVGDDYYIATSTFEWFPGVQIHHSKDLVRWEVITRPLTRTNQLDMLGNTFSDGVWAPCLSYCDGIFYLIYTNVKSSQVNPFKDTHNYLVTAENITGPWSDPIYLNSSGFDPSLFHDEDGRKWLVNMEWDYRKSGLEYFSGILLQEYDPKAKKLIGKITKISTGSGIGLIEGPHLYKKDGYYYLMVAEGGTSYQHAVSIARSYEITGPYEYHPNNPLLTAWEGDWSFKEEDIRPYVGSSRLKKAGHGSICQGKKGKWYLAHLCGRPVEESLRCILGRETSLQEIVWKEDGWCYLKQGGNRPAEYIEVELEDEIVKGANLDLSEEMDKKANLFLSGNVNKGLNLPLGAKTDKNLKLKSNIEADKCSDKNFVESSLHNSAKVYTFKDQSFLKDFQTLRIPYDEEFMSINKRKGFLRLRGRESIYSRFHQTLLARRQTDFAFEASTKMEFIPTSFMHMAGLIYRYNEENLYYLFVSFEDEKNCYTLNVVQVEDSKYTLLDQIVIVDTRIELVIKVNYARGRFYYRKAGKEVEVGPEFDTTIISDEYAKPMGFTGAFVGICVQDLQGQKAVADFEEFVYLVL